MIIRFDTQEVERRIDSFQRAIQKLQSLLHNINRINMEMRMVSWMSPAANEMADKNILKIARFGTMIKALNAYVAMLTNALAAIRKTEGLAEDRVAGLTSNAFGGEGSSCGVGLSGPQTTASWGNVSLVDNGGIGISASVLAVDFFDYWGSYSFGGNTEASFSYIGASAYMRHNLYVGPTGVNAYVSARAKFYNYSGSLAGTINVALFRFSAQISGYVGAAGFSGTFGVRDNMLTLGASGSKKLGVGARIGIGINQDFIPTAAARVQSIGNFVGNVPRGIRQSKQSLNKRFRW